MNTMTKTLKIAIAALVVGATLIPVALASSAQQGTPPSSQDNSVEPEMIAKMHAANVRAAAEDKLFANLGQAGEFIEKLPGYVAGNVPQYDSYWTASQLQTALGRQLTTDEADLRTALSALPYRIRTIASKVGQNRSLIADEIPVFEVTGNLNSGRAIGAYLDAKALPEITFGTPGSTATP